MKTIKILPPTWLLVALILMLVIHFLFPTLRIISVPWSLGGLAPLIAGIILSVQGENLFHRFNTTLDPGGQPAVLITTGVFRVSRNPMYLGFTLVALGVALMLGNALHFVLVGGVAILLDRKFIRPEEQTLAKAFGTEWDSYRKQVGRWIGW